MTLIKGTGVMQTLEEIKKRLQSQKPALAARYKVKELIWLCPGGRSI